MRHGRRKPDAVRIPTPSGLWLHHRLHYQSVGSAAAPATVAV
jgi:hypothetical protein